MTWDEFRAHTMPLAIQLGAEWDQPTWKLYHRAVERVPLAFYAAAVQTVAETWRSRTFPSAGKMREFAEQARQQALAAHPHEHCEICETTPGWQTVLVDGVPRLARCACWEAWRASLERLGLNGGPLALPPAEPVSEWKQLGAGDE
jgi:hypothetical protein